MPRDRHRSATAADAASPAASADGTFLDLGTTTRRRFLATAGAAALTLTALPGLACGGPERRVGRVLRSAARLPPPFAVPLTVPPVARPTRRTVDTDFYEIVQRPARAEILPALRTEIWGYDGRYPGPTIRSRSGRRVVVRHHNRLPAPTVVHLHGGRTPPESDGYPTDLVAPAAGWRWESERQALLCELTSQPYRDYVYPQEQRAATLWYHDHRMDFTGPQVWRGLAGFHLIADEQEDALPLPRGERDLPLMIADRSFAADGSLVYPSLDPRLQLPGVEEDFMEGVLGDVMLVNGRPWPFHRVGRCRYRLRLLNASNARRLDLELDPPPPDRAAFTQIGSDGGLLAAPLEHDHLQIAPAERFDVLVDFSSYPRGSRVALRNRDEDAEHTDKVMEFRVGRDEDDPSEVPPRLSTIEPLDSADAVTERELDFRRGPQRDGMRTWAINGRLFDPDRIDADPALGSVETWRLDGNRRHPIHLHLVHFQVLSRSSTDDRPGPFDAGWKDTVDIGSGDEVEIAARFDGYRGRYVLHCHNLEHEDMAMMANFRVS